MAVEFAFTVREPLFSMKSFPPSPSMPVAADPALVAAFAKDKSKFA
jgi:hypothetical protein